MRTSCARRAVSTAWAAVALALASAGPALAAPPQCTQPPPQTAVAEFPTALDLFEFCSDPDPGELTFAVSTAPAHGTAEISDGILLYTSAASHVGPDTISFTATAGGETTAPQTIFIMVVANQAPSCPAEIGLELESGEPITFDPYFECEDDGDIVDFPILEPPDHGSLEPYDYFEGFIYTPAPGYLGLDTFTVVAEDHAGARSEPILIKVFAPNRPPTCLVQLTVSVSFVDRVTVDPRTTCSDPDGDAVSFVIVSPPVNGRLEPAAAGTLDYIPDPVFVGFDRLLYRVEDPVGARSNLAALDFLVSPRLVLAGPADVSAPDAGVARAGPARLGQVRRSGLRLRLSSNESGTALVKLSVTKRTARRLRIDRKAKGPVEVGRVTQVLSSGDTDVVVRLTTRARRGFGRTRRVTVSVFAVVRDNAGNAATERLELVLRR